MNRTITVERYLPYPPSQVWRAVTDAKMLGKWFMESDFEPIIGRDFTFRKPPQRGWDGITWCTVTQLVPLQKVAYTYKGRASGEKTLACANIHSEVASGAVKGIFTELDTVLTFTVTPAGNGSRLLLEHSGFRGLKLIIVSLVMGMGWKKLIKEKLPAVLEQIANEGSLNRQSGSPIRSGM